LRALKPAKRRSHPEKPLPGRPLLGSRVQDCGRPFAGKLSILRIFSGTFTNDSSLYNPNKKVKERFGQIFILEGKKQQPTDRGVAGDIVAIPKLKDTGTGDTLCQENDPVVYKAVDPLPAVISYAVEAKVKGSEDKVFGSLARLLEEDPTLQLDRDQASSEIILSGVGQIHLEATCEKLNRKFGVEVNMKPMKVPYLETIKKPVQSVVYRHKKQTGGRGQFAEVHFDLFPQERGADTNLKMLWWE
jgi:elongation factor G